MIDIIFTKYLCEKYYYQKKNRNAEIEKQIREFALSIANKVNNLINKSGDEKIDDIKNDISAVAREITSRVDISNPHVKRLFLHYYREHMGDNISRKVSKLVIGQIERHPVDKTGKPSDDVKQRNSKSHYTTAKITTKTSDETQEPNKEEHNIPVHKAKPVNTDNHPGEKPYLKIKDLDQNIDTVNHPHWKRKLQKTNEEWASDNREHLKKEFYNFPSWVKYNQKIPQRYYDIIERMMSSNLDTTTKKSSFFFQNNYGAGTVGSQAGEILMMMASVMDKNNWKEIKKHMFDYIDRNGPSIITKTWIEAAEDNKDALYNRLKAEYPGIKLPDDIVASAWDIKEEVEAIGLSDYENNKGFSTDVYFKIKYRGKYILVEQSLKKDANVKLLNSTAARLETYSKDLPDEVKLSVYNSKQAKLLERGFKENYDKIQSMLSLLKNGYLANKVDFDTNIDVDSLIPPNTRDKRRVIVKVLTMLADNDHESAKNIVNEIRKNEAEYSTNCIHYILHNPQAREGLLNDIRGEFPLRSVSEGEEGISIGKLSLDRKVFKHIFGTTNWNSIKENISIFTRRDGVPYIGYLCSSKNTVIPISDIVIREDGVGYSGKVKLEMKLNRKFVSYITQANKVVHWSENHQLLEGVIFEKYLYFE